MGEPESESAYDAQISELGELLRDLYRFLIAESSKNVSGGLTFPQFMVLGHIKFGYDTVSMLANHSRISVAAVSKMVDGITKAGFLQRERSEEDRRLVRLVLTARGEEVLRENERIKQAVLKDSFSVLTEKEINELNALFKKVFQDKLIEERGQSVFRK